MDADTDEIHARVPTDVVLCFSTAPSMEVAQQLADRAVGAGLAACVSFLPGATSVYAWQGQVCRDAEVWLLIKTTRQAFSALARQWRNWHPYEVPELLAVPVVDGLPDYLQWVQASTGLTTGKAGTAGDGERVVSCNDSEARIGSGGKQLTDDAEPAGGNPYPASDEGP